MEEQVIRQIKSLALDMIDESRSGHPGIVLSAAPILYTLYTNHLKFNPLDSHWINRDRFVLSAGHGSALLYSMLYALGYELTLDDLKSFRKEGSFTPGHPEVNLTSGVDVTTGPLGQGIATAVGIALGERYLNSLLKNESGNGLLIDYYTYVLCSDGDLMEGISYEATSFAGQQKLSKLIVLYDSNDVSLDGDLDKTFDEDVQKRFESMGWQTILVKNGNNIQEINSAIETAKKELDRPTLIEVKTIIGYESNNQGKSIVHGKALETEDLNNLKKKWNLPEERFYVNENLLVDYRLRFKDRIQGEYALWSNMIINELKKEEVSNIFHVLDKMGKEPLDFSLLKKSNEEKELRGYNNDVMNFIADNTKLFIGGSADLSSSCKTYLNNHNDLTPGYRDGKNIWFGVREHAMGAIINGLSLTGLTPYGSTFLTFSDYLKPALRLSSLMNLNSTYIFTHDSIALGEDGPTHQPIEHLGMLRSIPGVNVYRPCDLNELIGSWQNILSLNKTSCLVINKNKTPLDLPSLAYDVKYGAYIISEYKERLDAIIIASGQEVLTALDIQKHLWQEGKDVRIVSMPCMELFENEDKLYQQTILPAGIKKVVLEASNDYRYLKYLSNEKYFINLTDFGSSGSKEEVLKKFDFDFLSLLKRINEII